jgi:hypothetical protein
MRGIASRFGAGGMIWSTPCARLAREEPLQAIALACLRDNLSHAAQIGKRACELNMVSKYSLSI